MCDQSHVVASSAWQAEGACLLTSRLCRVVFPSVESLDTET